MASRNCAKHALLSTIRPHVMSELSGTVCFLSPGTLFLAVHGVLWGLTPPASYHPPVMSAPSGALSPSAESLRQGTLLLGGSFPDLCAS